MYDKKRVMERAWELFHKNEELPFGECLHRSWLMAKAAPVNAERIARAKAEAGIEEETKTWSEWHNEGYEVDHGSKALFGCDLIWASKGDGVTYKARFFGASQVHKIDVAA